LKTEERKRKNMRKPLNQKRVGVMTGELFKTAPRHVYAAVDADGTPIVVFAFGETVIEDLDDSALLWAKAEDLIRLHYVDCHDAESLPNPLQTGNCTIGLDEGDGYDLEWFDVWGHDHNDDENGDKNIWRFEASGILRAVALAVLLSNWMLRQRIAQGS
jgi:hypothetical protein